MPSKLAAFTIDKACGKSPGDTPFESKAQMQSYLSRPSSYEGYQGAALDEYLSPSKQVSPVKTADR